MTWVGRLLRREGRRPASVSTRRFHSTPLSDHIALQALHGGPVTKREALMIPGLLRGRNEICGALAALALEVVDADNRVVPNAFIRQPDPDIATIAHISQTIEDLLFYGVSWWRITGYDWTGYPARCRRVEPTSVSVNAPSGRGLAPLPGGLDPRDGSTVFIDGLPVPISDVIRFDSPLPALLDVGQLTIRKALALARTAEKYAQNPQPSGYLRATPGAEDLPDEEVPDLLAEWQADRKAGATGYLPKSLEYVPVSAPSPVELQLVQLIEQSTKEIAQLVGLDSEELNVSTTSRTYANVNDRRTDKINETYAPLMVAVTDRLSIAGNVLPRGYRVRFRLDQFLRANATERWANYKTAVELGAMTVDEIRAAEGLPPLSPSAMPEPEPAPVPDPMPQEESTVDAHRVPEYQFTADFTRVDIPLETFSVDTESRTIEGTAVPYGKSAKGIRFERNSLKFVDVKRVKLNVDHDSAQIIGVATAVKDGPNGLHMKFRIARTPEGDRALSLAEDGILDGLSVGVDFDATRDAVADPRNKTGLLVQRADLRHVALTGEPAFDDARLTRVAASNTQEVAVENDTDTTPETSPETPAQVPATYSAEQVAAMFAAMNAPGPATTANTAPVQPRTVVNPIRPVAVTHVTQGPGYRFTRDGTLLAGENDFGYDFIAAAKSAREDSPEYRRVMEFMRYQFDVQVADVNDLHPLAYLPRYIDEHAFDYPLLAATTRGAPPNGVQPFTWPIYSTASNFVATHSEGTEPTSGNYVTATHATITPTALSGKASITRETWDLGGSPGVGDLIWRKVVRDWFENVEAHVASTLDSASPTSLGTFTAGGGTDKRTLIAELQQYMAQLQFARGGFRFTDLFAEFNFYRDIVSARDSSGRPIYPALSPMNADGTAGSRWASVNVNGVSVSPTWALGAVASTNADSSYLIDRTAVDAWYTPPQRLEFNHEVRYVHLGVWGYKAATINDINGVREISYDSAT